MHLVNDLRSDIDFAVVDAVASWAGGSQRWRFGGPVPADEVVKVGTVDFVVPDTLGELAIELEMTALPHRVVEPLHHRRHPPPGLTIIRVIGQAMGERAAGREVEEVDAVDIHVEAERLPTVRPEVPGSSATTIDVRRGRDRLRRPAP